MPPEHSRVVFSKSTNLNLEFKAKGSAQSAHDAIRGAVTEQNATDGNLTVRVRRLPRVTRSGSKSEFTARRDELNSSDDIGSRRYVRVITLLNITCGKLKS